MAMVGIVRASNFALRGSYSLFILFYKVCKIRLNKDCLVLNKIWLLTSKTQNLSFRKMKGIEFRISEGESANSVSIGLTRKYGMFP
jgi:hypothetical protein